MTISGNVVSFEIGKKGDSTTDTVILQVAFSDPDDIRPVEWLPGAGVDSVPAIGSRVIVHELSAGYLVAIGGNDAVTPTAASGETEIYSTADGTTKASWIKCKPDGSIEINAPAGLKVTANTDITGTLTVTGIIKSVVDIIADHLASAITLLTHFHIGNLGYNTGAPVAGAGTPPPGSPISATGGDLDMNGNNIINVGTVDGKVVSTHTHPITSGSSSPGPTGPPT